MQSSKSLIPDVAASPSAQVPVSKHRWWAIGTLAGALLLLGMIAALVIVVDPFQHYRKATFYIPLVEREIQRYINVGIARNYEYDTLSMGSSMTENTRTSDIEAAFGGKALHLPYRGAALVNYSLLMRNAFRAHDIKRVIICIDDVSFTDNPASGIEEQPLYLYDNNIFSDVYYWFNLGVLERLPELYVYNRYGQGKPSELQLDTLYNWSDGLLYGKSRVFTEYSHWDMKKVPAMALGPIIPMVEGNLRQHFLPFIEAHPETEFIIVYPPYSTLQWYHTYLNGQEDRFLYGREEFARVLLAYPNVRIFDFQTNEEWATNYEIYCDFTHYHGIINTEYMAAMGRGEYEVHTVEEVQANNRIIRGFMLDFVPPTAEERARMREESFAQVQERLLWQ